MWHKGLAHYHTQFNYPPPTKVGPEELAERLLRAGCSFCFCAGDHGDNDGIRKAWGFLPSEYRAYKAACMACSGEAVLLPAPELHLRFPPLSTRSEHHACLSVPASDMSFGEELFDSDTMAVRDPESFILKVHERGGSLVLNHPYLSMCIPAFNGPPPASKPILAQMDYFEMFTTDHPDMFQQDFAIYRDFLANPISAAMGCCAGVDKIDVPDFAKVPATGLFIEGDLSAESVLDAWLAKRSYAVYGDIQLNAIIPVPSTTVIAQKGGVNIELSATAFNDETLRGVEIYRNGTLVRYFKIEFRRTCAISWSDADPLPGQNSYVIHILGASGDLVSSPIHCETP